MKNETMTNDSNTMTIMIMSNNRLIVFDSRRDDYPLYRLDVTSTSDNPICIEYYCTMHALENDNMTMRKIDENVNLLDIAPECDADFLERVASFLDNM